MSGHAIKNGIPFCNEPETADCRARWDYNTCGCESFGDLTQNPDGTWTHTIYDTYADDGVDVEHTSIGTYPAHACNICNWLNDDITGTWQSESPVYGWHHYLDNLPDGPIRVEWELDFYTWDYTDPRVLGGFIGRLVVARWADDLGLAS